MVLNITRLKLKQTYQAKLKQAASLNLCLSIGQHTTRAEIRQAYQAKLKKTSSGLTYILYYL